MTTIFNEATTLDGAFRSPEERKKGKRKKQYHPKKEEKYKHVKRFQSLLQWGAHIFFNFKVSSNSNVRDFTYVFIDATRQEISANGEQEKVPGPTELPFGSH